MRIGMIMDYSGGFGEAVELLADYERVGLELVAVPEAYSFDAVSQLGYVAARTRTAELMSAILPIYTRTPSLTAMTAAGLDFVSGGRFTLGLGASGPQVVEGFHGVVYDAPLARTREIIEICRQIWRREALQHRGSHYRIPLTAEDGGSGLGKSLKLINHPVRSRIPVSVAALGPANIELVAQIAEGWQPLFFHPGRADQAFGEPLARGRARRAADLGDLDLQLQLTFSTEDDPAHLERVKDQIALYVGGMGARGKNFYHRLAHRYAYGPEADEIQDLYLSGRKQDAARAVPDDLARAVSLLDDETRLPQRLAELAAAGVTTLLLTPVSSTPERQVADVAALVGARDRLGRPRGGMAPAT